MTPGDEARHPGEEPEAFWFWFWAGDGGLGGYAGTELSPGGAASYHAALVRRDRPLLHVTETAAGRPRGGALLLKPEGLWADATCEEPFRQWTVVNECYGVELDDPWEAVGRAYGTPRPVAFDLEWYATADPVPVPGGYVQDGEVLGVVELHDGELHLPPASPARRLHVWGRWWRPEDEPADGLLAPVRRADGTVLGMALTPTGWRCWLPGEPPGGGGPARSPSA